MRIVAVMEVDMARNFISEPRIKLSRHWAPDLVEKHHAGKIHAQSLMNKSEEMGWAAHQSRRIKGFGQMPRVSLITNATTTAARQWGHEWFSQRHSDSSSFYHHHPYWFIITTNPNRPFEAYLSSSAVPPLRQLAVLAALLHSIDVTTKWGHGIM